MGVNEEYMKALNCLVDRFEFLQRSGVSFVPSSAGTVALQRFGDAAAGLIIITDADIAPDGVAYAGPAGKLLAGIINAMKFDPAGVFAISGTKAAASGKNPETLRSLLENELSKRSPKAIVSFGPVSSGALAGQAPPAQSSGAPFFDWKGIKVLQAPCLEEMLENKKLKHKAWSHLQTVMKEFGKTPA